MNGVYIIGVGVYFLILKRTKPSRFYRVWFVAMAVVLGALSALLLFDVSTLVLSLANSGACCMFWCEPSAAGTVLPTPGRTLIVLLIAPWAIFHSWLSPSLCSA